MRVSAVIPRSFLTFQCDSGQWHEDWAAGLDRLQISDSRVLIEALPNQPVERRMIYMPGVHPTQIENNTFVGGSMVIGCCYGIEQHDVIFVSNFVQSSPLDSLPLIDVRTGSTITFLNNLVDGESSILFREARAIEMMNNTVINRRPILTLSPGLYTNSSTLAFNNILISKGEGENSSERVIEQLSLPAYGRFENNIVNGDTGFWNTEANNVFGSPVFSDVESEDYHLMENSIGVDAGINEPVEALITFDIEGNPRIFNGVVDIGAYERATEALHPADTNRDNAISQEEFDAYNAAWRSNESWPNPPASIEADYVTRAGYLVQKGGAYKNIGVGKPLTWVPVNE